MRHLEVPVEGDDVVMEGLMDCRQGAEVSAVMVDGAVAGHSGVPVSVEYGFKRNVLGVKCGERT